MRSNNICHKALVKLTTVHFSGLSLTLLCPITHVMHGEWLGRPKGTGYNARMRDKLTFRAATAARLEFIVKES